MKKILIIEDNTSLAKELEELLNKNGYNSFISDGGDYKSLINENTVDLILLDINLPHESGFEICSYVKSTIQIPVIILTGRNANIDEVMGLSLGADDYIKKPYHAGVLLARIKRLLAAENTENIKTYRGISLDIRKNKITYSSKEIFITKTETLILDYLINRPEEVVPRVELIEFLWDNQSFVDDNTLSVNVSRLRKKLESIGIENIIKTVPKQGYVVWVF